MKKKSHEFAEKVKKYLLEMINKSKSAHVGSSLSAVDILSCLYSDWLRFYPENPQWAERDRLILSKGHAAAVHYATLCTAGFFPESWLASYCMNDTNLPGHSTHKKCPGVEVSTGSLGHGLPIGTGIALGKLRDKKAGRVVVVLSDGELNEGSNWEALMLAGAHKLTNLVVVVDYNKIQSFGRTDEVMSLEPLGDKFASFGWAVSHVDGHSHDELKAVLGKTDSLCQPLMVIAHTIKGKGLPDLENTVLSHYRPPSEEQIQACIAAG